MYGRSSRWRRQVTILAGILTSCAVSGVGGQPAQTNIGEIATVETPLKFTSRLSLVSVPVVVRNSKGQAVSGLEKNDFLLFDNGKPQIVSSFSREHLGSPESPGASGEVTEIGAAAAPAARIPTRFVALLFDDLHTEFGDLVWARQAAEKFIASLPTSERVALYTTSGHGGIDFTADRDALIKELRSIRPFASEYVGCLRISYFIADWIRRENCAPGEFNNVTCPTKAAMVREAVDCRTSPIRDSNSVATALEIAATRAVIEGDRNTRRAINAIGAAIGKLATAPGQRQIVFVSDGFLVLDEHREAETFLTDVAIRARVIVSTLDARGVKPYVPDGDAGERGSLTALGAMLKIRYAAAEVQAAAAVMDEIATATGGRYFHGNNDMELGLARLAGIPEYRYVLTFAPQNLKFDGRYHSLKVSLRNEKGLAVEARRGYYAPNRKLSPAEQARDEIQAAFFSTEEIRELPASMETQFLKTGDYEATVNVVARVNVKQLKYKQELGRNRNNVTVVCGLFNENGNYVTGIQKVLEMRLRDETLAGRLASGIAVKTSLKATPGKYIVRMVIRDSEGRQLTALARDLEIP